MKLAVRVHRLHVCVCLNCDTSINVPDDSLRRYLSPQQPPSSDAASPG